MTKPYDATAKELVELAPADWLAFLGTPRPPELVSLIDADVSTVTASADKVIRVADDPPWLLHLEFQAAWDGSLPVRTLLYNAVLQHRHGVPVASAVLLLAKDANASSVTGLHRVALPFGSPWEFKYTVVKLWEVPVDVVLTGPLAAVPLAPLCDLPPGRFATLAVEMNARFEAEATVPRQDVLWAAVGQLLGMRYDKMTAEELWKSLPQDSPGVQALNSVAEKRHARRIIYRHGERLFGAPPSPEVRAAIEAINDITQLDALCERTLDVKTWDDLLKTP